MCGDSALGRHFPWLGRCWELLLHSCKRISASQTETRSSSKEQQGRRGKEMAFEDCVKDKWEMMLNNSINYKKS